MYYMGSSEWKSHFKAVFFFFFIQQKITDLLLILELSSALETWSSNATILVSGSPSMFAFIYRKFPKYSDPKNICCYHSKIWTMRLYHRVMSPNDADGMANSVDPDQTAPLGAVWSGPALFAQAYLSENLWSLWYLLFFLSGKAYDVTYIRLRFHSPRPESFAIYKRTTVDGPWIPYQFYSASCKSTYKLEYKQYVTREKQDEALCSDEYSDISPLTGGEVPFSTLEGRPDARNFEQSPVLQV